MSLDVRPIAPDELLDWVAAMYAAFHNNRAPAAEADYRRDVLGQDFGRSLAAVDGQKIVGTYESFSAELTLPGQTCIKADAVSSVSVLPTHHRRGMLTRMIETDLRAAQERGEAASILIAAEYPIYGRFGFGPAVLRAEYSLDPSLTRFTRQATGQVDLVEAARLRELAPPLFDRFRASRPGQIDRRPAWWDTRLGLRETPWGRHDQRVYCATYTGQAGDVEGYLTFVSGEGRRHHMPSSQIDISELIALSSDAYLGLWQFCVQMDLVSEIKAAMRCAEEPLQWLLHNPRAALQLTRRGDFLWLRPLDIPRLLSARRYAVQERLVLDISDPMGLSGGRFVLEGGPDGATCRATSEAADLSMNLTALGAISLGGVNPHVLADAGLIDEDQPGALDRAERMFHWPITPWCSTFF